MTVTTEFRNHFISWALAQGCTASPHLKIKDSPLGGSGVFLSLKDLELTKDGRLEVMRIPKELTFSLDRFAERLLQPQQEFDADLDDDVLRQSEALVGFMTAFTELFEEQIDPYVKGGVSETNILVGQVQMLVILMKLRKELMKKDSEKYSKLQESPFAKLDEFWELLELTDVPALGVDKHADKFRELFKYNLRDYRKRIERLKYNAVYQALDSLELDVDYKEFVNDDFLRRIELSVISRLLEIPERIEMEQDPEATVGDTEEEDDKPKYGFAVSSTLVPLIDFVNHSNDDMNAFFDVDPTKSSVLLRVFNDKLSQARDEEKDEVELFIRYSDHEDTLKFAHAYGFIPRSYKLVKPLFELALDRGYVNDYIVRSEVDGVKYEHHLGLLLKWIQVQPNVQFVLTYNSEGKLDDVKMNLDENFIVFGFVKGMTYHKEAALQIVKYYSELQEDEYIADLLELEESEENDLIEGYDVIPYTSVYVEDQLNLAELVENVPDEEVDQLMLEFLAFFDGYAKWRLEILEKELKEMSGDSIVREFAQLESDILHTYRDKWGSANDEEKLNLIIGSEDVDDEWLTQRLRPRTVPGEQRMSLYEAHVGPSLEGLKIDDDN